MGGGERDRERERESKNKVQTGVSRKSGSSICWRIIFLSRTLRCKIISIVASVVISRVASIKEHG